MPQARTDDKYSLLVHPPGPFDAYREGTAPTLDRALGLLEAAKTATWSENGDAVEFVYADEDRLTIVGPGGMELKSWSRARGDIGHDLTASGRRPIVGWQLVDAGGYNIHGGEHDPFGIASFEILGGDAVRTAMDWAAENDGFAVVPVRDGDIEDPSFVSHISESISPAMAP